MCTSDLFVMCKHEAQAGRMPLPLLLQKRAFVCSFALRVDLVAHEACFMGKLGDCSCMLHTCSGIMALVLQKPSALCA